MRLGCNGIINSIKRGNELKKRGYLFKFGEQLAKARASVLEGFYSVHVRIRYVHDKAYQHGPRWYKRWTDKNYSEAIHRAAFFAFVFSYIIFYSLQYLAPLLMNPLRPGEALAGTSYKTWMTRGDFLEGTPDSNVVISGTQAGDDANVSLKPGALGWTADTSLNGAPTGRYGHTTIWTGDTGNPITANKMIVWGGGGCCDENENGWRENTGGIYDPTTNTWTQTSTDGAPTARELHSAIWTGNTGNPTTANKMIVWGGALAGSTGGIYDPATNSWSPTTLDGAPTGRGKHVAIWTGNTGNAATEYRMVIWGGGTATGGIYDPATNSWSPTSTGTGTPSNYYGNTGVWTGSEMIIWGGSNVNGGTGRIGSIYNLANGTWRSVTQNAAAGTEAAPAARQGHTAVWTGSEMVIWGGGLNTGGIWKPQGAGCSLSGGCWVATSLTTVPAARTAHTAVWTGSKMIIWGGYQISGGIWVPMGTEGCAVSGGCWTSTSEVNAPTARGGHTAVWTGNEMVIWGGDMLDSGKKLSPTYVSNSVITGLTTGQSQRVRYSKAIIGLSNQLPVNATVVLAVRAADTSADLTGASFYDLSSVTQISSLDSGCTAISVATNKICYSGNVVGASGGVLFGKYAELRLTLATADGFGTPVVDGISLHYETLEDPQNVSLKRSDGTTTITEGYTNETEIKVAVDNLTCTGCTGTTTGRKIQVQYKKNEDGVFDSPVVDEATNFISGSSVDNGNGTYSSIAVIAGLDSGKSYQLRYRATDDAGRLTGWNYFGSGINTVAENDFTVDQVAPSLGNVLINSGAQYVNNKLVTLNLTGASDVASGLSKMRFSNNGTDWSAWEAYNATKSNWDLTLYGGNADEGPGNPKKVYAQVQDAAGNTSGNTKSTEAEFEGAGYSKGSGIGIDASGNISLTVPGGSEVISVPNGTNCVEDYGWMCDITKNYTADQVKVDWTGTAGAGIFIKIPAGGSNIYTNASAPPTGTTDWRNGNSVNITWSDNMNGSLNDTFTIYYRGTQYPVSDVYTSPTVNLGNGVEADLISWVNAAKPGDSSVKFQVASKPSDSGWTDGDYIGPDGTTLTFYTASTGQALSSHHAGKQYLRYKAILNSTSDRTQTPVLDLVSIESKLKSQTVTLDTQAPGFSGSLVYSNGSNYVKQGQTQTITANFTEAMASAPIISINYAGAGSDVTNAAMSQGANAAIWTYPAVIPAGNDGAATVSFSGTDLAGNAISGSPGGNTFVVDNTAPVTTAVISAPDTGAYYTEMPSVTFDVEDASAVTTKYYWDNGIPADAPVSSLPTDGAHTLHYYSIDTAGNQEAPKSSGVLTFDVSGPNVSDFSINTSYLTTAGVAAVKNTQITLSVAATDAISGVNNFQLSSDGVIFGDTFDYNAVDHDNLEWIIDPEEDLGTPQEIYLKIIDNVGNETIENIEVVYDNTPPNSTVIAPASVNGGTVLLGVGQVPNPYWYPYGTPYFNFSATTDPNALPAGIKGYKYCFSTSASCTPSTFTTNSYYQPTIASQNIYYLRVISVDNVDLESGITTYNYNYDATPPASAVYGLEASTTGTGEIALNWEAVDVGATVAPIKEFKIERIKNSVYTTNSLTPNGTWTTGNAVTDAGRGYAAIITENLTSYVDSAENPPSGQAAIQTGTKYIYRISYRDKSNAAYSPLPTTYNYLSVGFTKDQRNPTSPTSVQIFACDGTNNCSSDPMDGSRTHKGHEIKVTWNPSTDGAEGSGIGGYLIYRKQGDSLDPTGWTLAGEVVMPGELVWYDNDYRVHQDNTIYPKTTGDKAAVLNDFTYYNYRVVAFDNATTDYLSNGQPDRNNSGLFPAKIADDMGPEEDMFTNLNDPMNPVRTPDVTAPTLPTGIIERRDGLDSSREHQQINLYWDANYNLANADNDPAGNATLKIYGYQGNATRVDNPNKALFTDWTSQFTDRPSDSNPNSYIVQNLLDYTYYYFYLKVTDRWGNTAETPVITPPAKTGNSLAPGAVSGVNIDTFYNFSNSELGDKAYLSFNGALHPGCNESDGTNCVVQYEIYLAETDDRSSCTDGSDPDACWLQKNTTQKFTIDQPENKTKDQRPSPPSPFTYTLSGLNDATKYFVRVRAKANSSDPETTYGPFNDPTAMFITPDVTAPSIPEGTGLNVKVKDSYPNTSILRNIITWQMPETPMRNRIDDSCPALRDDADQLILVNGKEQCNDFSKYKIYRQIVDVAGEPLGEPTEIRTITNFEENFYIDPININTDIALLDANIKYLIEVVDNSDTTFAYPNGTLVNRRPNGSTFANASTRSASLNDIIPNHTYPRLAGNVSIAQVEVSSAVIEWDTDQATDSLVEYREWGAAENTPWVAVGSRNNVNHHSVRIFDLKTDTQYEYRVVSRNYLANDLVVTKDNYNEKLQLGNLPTSTYPTLKTDKFKIEIPVDSSKFMTRTTSTVQFNWTTTKGAKTNYIEYEAKHDPNNAQLRGIAGQLATSDGYNLTAHDVVLKGLRPKTTYRFKIKSVSIDNYQSEYPEGAGNYLEFETNSYDTSQFTISPSSSNVAERNITSTTAQIVWSTANPTTSWVDYSSKSGTYDMSSGNNDLNTQHAVVLQGLVPGTKYFYKVRGTDDYGNTYTSQEFTFTAVLKPKISNLKISDVTPYSVVISWETNIDTETLMNWGRSTAYGEKRGVPESTKNHTIKIENLEDNVEYHYQILARDGAGNEVADEDRNVRTPLDTSGPKISDVKNDIILNEADNTAQVIISWKTDKPSTTLVQYDEGVIGGKYNKNSIEDTGLSTNHTVIIKDLAPGITYHYRIVTRDKRGNETISNDYNFITPTAEKSILQLILKSLEETFSWIGNLGNFFSGLGKKTK